MKKIILSLFVGLILFITCFSSAGSYNYSYNIPAGTYNKGRTLFSVPLNINLHGNSNSFSVDCSFSSFDGVITDSTNDLFQLGGLFYTNNSSALNIFNLQRTLLTTVFSSEGGSLHLDVNQSYFYPYFGMSFVNYSNPITLNSFVSVSCVISGSSIIIGSSSCPECPTCPEVNTGEILSGYILKSEIDSGYCVSNDLCPVFTGNNFSELIINDVVHESAPLINITIPQEYSRDYSLNENEFTLDISGYNVDYDYIDGIIKTQNSKPTVEDFNKIISDLLPLFVPGLVIILFLIFVFRFVKKVF